MRLKIITTALMIMGVAMLLAFPFVIGPQPARAEGQRALAEYAIKFGSYIIIAVLIFAGAILCSIIMLRQIRKEMRQMAENNMQAFVSGTLEDHATKEARRKKFDSGRMQDDLRDHFTDGGMNPNGADRNKRSGNSHLTSGSAEERGSGPGSSHRDPDGDNEDGG